MTNDIKLTAGDYMIQQSDKIKILGLYFTNGLDNGPNVTKIIQKVNYRINVLNKIIKLTNTKTSLILYNSLVISIFNYCIGCFINNTSKQNQKLNSLINKCSHKLLGLLSYSKSSSYNLKQLNWVSYYHMMIIGASKLFHKVILYGKPLAYNQYIKQSLINNEGTRRVRHSYIARNSTTSKTSNSLFYRSVKIYNSLPLTLKHLESKQFNKMVKSVVRKTFSLDRVL